MRPIALALTFILAFTFVALARDEPPMTPTQVLDDFHDAAAKADGARYFAYFTDDAVFLGTDARERWTVAKFRAYAEPIFAAGRGWTYTARERHVTLSPGGDVAWFDERLHNEKYGTCRGSGVLVRADGRWRIAQYNLSFPIPNELAGRITTMIREHDVPPDAP